MQFSTRTFEGREYNKSEAIAAQVGSGVLAERATSEWMPRTLAQAGIDVRDFSDEAMEEINGPWEHDNDHEETQDVSPLKDMLQGMMEQNFFAKPMAETAVLPTSQPPRTR